MMKPSIQTHCDLARNVLRMRKKTETLASTTSLTPRLDLDDGEFFQKELYNSADKTFV